MLRKKCNTKYTIIEKSNFFSSQKSMLMIEVLLLLSSVVPAAHGCKLLLSTKQFELTLVHPSLLYLIPCWYQRLL